MWQYFFEFARKLSLKKIRHNGTHGHYTFSEILLRNCALHLHRNQNF